MECLNRLAGCPLETSNNDATDLKEGLMRRNAEEEVDKDVE
jgi:hypothetical protein